MEFKEFLAESTKDLHNYLGKNSPKFKAIDTAAISANAKEYHEKAFPNNSYHQEFDLQSDPPDSVKQHVEENGGKLGESGHTVTLKSGREVPTSKFLGKSKAPRHINKDYEDFARHGAAGGNTKLVISRHPHEVACASTGTHWNSCANLTKDYYEAPAAAAMHNEISHGTMIAMHVHKDAPKNEDGQYDAKHMLGRVLIKKHLDNNHETHYYPEGKTYGKFPKSALDKVHEFVGKHNPKDFLYAQKNENVYHDDDHTLKLNPNAKPKDIIKNYHNLPWKVQNSLATSKHTHPDVLSHMVDNSTGILIKGLAAKNPNLPKDKIHELINGPDQRVSRSALTNPTLTSDELTKIYHKLKDAPQSNFEGFVENENTPKHVLHDILDKGYKEEGIYSHPNIGQAHISKALSGDDKYAAEEAAGNPNISHENLMKAVEHPHSDVHSKALENKNATDEHFERALENNKFRYGSHLSAIHNPNMSREMLAKYARHHDDNVSSDAKELYRRKYKQ